MPDVALYMLMFLFSLIASGAITRTFWLFAQEGGAFDIWQKMLDRLYKAGPSGQLLGKALGDCGQCTAFWMGLAMLPVHIAVVTAFMPWPIEGVGYNVIYGLVWWNIAGLTNFYFIKNIL